MITHPESKKNIFLSVNIAGFYPAPSLKNPVSTVVLIIVLFFIEAKAPACRLEF